MKVDITKSEKNINIYVVYRCGWCKVDMGVVILDLEIIQLLLSCAIFPSHSFLISKYPDISAELLAVLQVTF